MSFGTLGHYWKMVLLLPVTSWVTHPWRRLRVVKGMDTAPASKQMSDLAQGWLNKIQYASGRNGRLIPYNAQIPSTIASHYTTKGCYVVVA